MFKNRIDAGRVLAEKLFQMKLVQPCLLAVPRGGVVVAKPIAEKLNAKIGVLVTRKVGHPLNPEVAIGAVMPDGAVVWDREQVRGIGITQELFQQLAEREYAEIKRRIAEYTGSGQLPDVKGKTVIIIDDGIATGYTIRAAVNWLKTLDAASIIIAVPVAPPEIVQELLLEVDEVICPVQPKNFAAVGMFYEDFSQTTDEEVMNILQQNR